MPYSSSEKHRSRVNTRRQLIKQKAVNYKGSVCRRCGKHYPHFVFDFHHIDPRTKIDKLKNFMDLGWDRMKLELDKCILLCANCHRIEHHNKKEEETMNEIINETPVVPGPVVTPKTEPVAVPAAEPVYVQPEEDFAGVVQPM